MLLHEWSRRKPAPVRVKMMPVTLTQRRRKSRGLSRFWLEKAPRCSFYGCAGFSGRTVSLKSALFGTPEGSPRTDKLIDASTQWAERIMEKLDRLFQPTGLESRNPQGQGREEERYHPTGRKEDVMSTEKSRKCAHIPCVCTTSQGEKYCGQPCKDAGSGEAEIACPCGHPACATKASAATTRR